MHINTGSWNPPPNLRSKRAGETTSSVRCRDRRGRPPWKMMITIVTHRRKEGERGGASHGCRWAGRKESCTLAAVARVTVSRQRRQTHRNRALNNTYLLDMRESLETLLTSSRRC